MVDYGEILTRTWQITWRYKGLWVLGLLAGCGTGGGGGGGGGSGSGWEYSADSSQIGQAMLGIPGWVWIALGVAALALILLFLVLGVIATGGLIAAFRQADEGKDVRLGEAFRLGTRYFWRLLSFRLVMLLFGVVLAGLVLVAAIGSLGICLIPLICIGIPLAFLITVYVSLAQVALIDDEQRTLDGFRRGWEVLRASPGPALLMGLILLGGGLIVALILAVPIFLLMLPLFVALASEEQTVVVGGVLIASLCTLGLLPILLVVNAVLQTFLNGAWTLTYRRLTGKAAGAPALPELAIPQPG